MTFTCNFTFLFVAFYLVGIVEFACLCHRAPFAPEDESLEDRGT